MSSTARLVVLDERDYQSLKERAQRPKSPEREPEKEPEKEPERVPSPVLTEEPADQPQEEVPSGAPEEPKPAESEIPPPTEPEESEESELQKLLAPIPQSGHQAALGLLKRLTSLPEFGFDPISGRVKLHGKPVENYTLQKLLLATSKKSAKNDLPQVLRTFLRERGIRKFRNSSIKLVSATKPWKSFHASYASTQRRGM